MKLLDRATTNGAGQTYQVPISHLPPATQVREYLVMAWGSFGGGTVALEVSPDDGSTWITAASFTSEGLANVKLPKMAVRGNLTGATSPNVSLALLG